MDATDAHAYAGRWRTYPAYKPSGVEWLGDIPARWEVSRLKDVANINPESLSEATDPDYILQYIDISNVDEVNGVNPPHEMRFENAPSRARRVVRSGDTIISTVRTYLKAIAYFDNPPDNLIASTGFAVLRPKKQVIPQYLSALMRCPLFIETVVACSTGVSYPAIAPTVLSTLPVWLPSLEEQHAIAAFLDRETARLDALIAKKQRLIELLQEKRTALISQAVTKGLDLNVQMKDSEVEWLGKIPCHWYVMKFSQAAFFQEGPGLRNWQFTDSGVRVICVTNITEFGIDFSRYEKFISYEEYTKTYEHFTVNKGDYLLSSSGNSWGKIAEFNSDETVILNTSTIRLNESHPAILKRRMLKWTLQADSTREQLGQLMTGSCQPNFGPSHFSRTYVPIPPIDEQNDIAKFLEQETVRIDLLIAKANDAIERLREYRTALIAAAVTGKIDVRPSPQPSP